MLSLSLSLPSDGVEAAVWRHGSLSGLVVMGEAGAGFILVRIANGYLRLAINVMMDRERTVSQSGAEFLCSLTSSASVLILPYNNKKPK